MQIPTLGAAAILAAMSVVPGQQPTGDRLLRVAVLLLDGVYNSELVAPYDVFQHTVFHAEPGMEVFTVGRTRDVVRSFEGLRILPDHDLDAAPPFDVLVVPSAEHSMDTDLEDQALIAWLAARGPRARHLLSVCDGAFLLAAAGLLDGRMCTTFPGDIPAFRRRFPELTVIEEVSFVADQNVITGAGGAASYDPAMYLVQQLYGVRVAEGIGRGLVIDWQLDAVRHLVVDRPPDDDAVRVTSFLPDETVPGAVELEDADGARRRLDELAQDARAVVLVLLGGGAAIPLPARGGMWCEDSFSELALLRRLVRDYEPRGVVFVPVLCPPVHDEERFGFEPGVFLGAPADDPRFVAARGRFVAASRRLLDDGLLPFREIWFDLRMVLMTSPSAGAIPDPAWRGRFKWYADPQTYGTPTIWVLRPDLRVFGAPFCRNNYEADGGRLHHAERDVSARLDRLLRQ